MLMAKQCGQSRNSSSIGVQKYCQPHHRLKEKNGVNSLEEKNTQNSEHYLPETNITTSQLPISQQTFRPSNKHLKSNNFISEADIKDLIEATGRTLIPKNNIQEAEASYRNLQHILGNLYQSMKNSNSNDYSSKNSNFNALGSNIGSSASDSIVEINSHIRKPTSVLEEELSDIKVMLEQFQPKSTSSKATKDSIEVVPGEFSSNLPLIEETLRSSDENGTEHNQEYKTFDGDETYDLKTKTRHNDTDMRPNSRRKVYSFPNERMVRKASEKSISRNEMTKNGKREQSTQCGWPSYDFEEESDQTVEREIANQDIRIDPVYKKLPHYKYAQKEESEMKNYSDFDEANERKNGSWRNQDQIKNLLQSAVEDKDYVCQTLIIQTIKEFPPYFTSDNIKYFTKLHSDGEEEDIVHKRSTDGVGTKQRFQAKKYAKEKQQKGYGRVIGPQTQEEEKRFLGEHKQNDVYEKGKEIQSNGGMFRSFEEKTFIEESSSDDETNFEKIRKLDERKDSDLNDYDRYRSYSQRRDVLYPVNRQYTSEGNFTAPDIAQFTDCDVEANFIAPPGADYTNSQRELIESEEPKPTSDYDKSYRTSYSQRGHVLYPVNRRVTSESDFTAPGIARFTDSDFETSFLAPPEADYTNNERELDESDERKHGHYDDLKGSSYELKPPRDLYLFKRQDIECTFSAPDVAQFSDSDMSFKTPPEIEYIDSDPDSVFEHHFQEEIINHSNDNDDVGAFEERSQRSNTKDSLKRPCGPCKSEDNIVCRGIRTDSNVDDQAWIDYVSQITDSPPKSVSPIRLKESISLFR